MSFKKYVTAIFVNQNVIPYQFKHTRTLQMVVGCWLLGRFPIFAFPVFVITFRGSLEILPPIIVATIFVSIPSTFLTIGISQYSKRGWIKLWDAVPAWRGIGIVGTLCLYVTSLLTASLCSYFLYYTVRSLEAKTPWLECDDQEFVGEACFTFIENRSIRLDCIDMYSEEYCSQITWKNSALYFLDNTVKFKKKDEEFYFNHELVPYQVAVTILVYICLRNSTASLALFSPFLLLLPTLLHGILLIRSFLHPGTLIALQTIGEFKFTNFLDIEFWFDVGTVSLYSVGFAYGGLSNLGVQYNFRHPINIDAVFLNLVSVTYCIMYTVFIYNLCGILSYELNLPIETVLDFKENPNFIHCPLSFTYLNMTKFWTFIFFLSNFLVLLRTLSTQCEMVLCVFYEIKPILKSYTIPCALVLSVTHLFWNVLTNFEKFHEFIFQLDELITYNIVPTLGFFLYVFLNFFYGVMHFVDDMHFMLGFRPSNIWKLNWYLGFLINLALLIYCWYWYEQLSNNVLNYILMVIAAVLGFFPLIYFIVFILVQRNKNVAWSEIFKSTKDWGPRDEVLRKSRDMFSAHDMTKEYLYRQQRLKFKTTDKSVSRIDASLNVNM